MSKKVSILREDLVLMDLNIEYLEMLSDILSVFESNKMLISKNREYVFDYLKKDGSVDTVGIDIIPKSYFDNDEFREIQDKTVSYFRSTLIKVIADNISKARVKSENLLESDSI